METKKLVFFVLISAVGGLVIGIAVGTDISPVISGLIGAIIISTIAVIINNFWGGLTIGE